MVSPFAGVGRMIGAPDISNPISYNPRSTRTPWPVSGMKISSSVISDKSMSGTQSGDKSNPAIFGFQQWVIYHNLAVYQRMEFQWMSILPIPFLIIYPCRWTRVVRDSRHKQQPVSLARHVCIFSCHYASHKIYHTYLFCWAKGAGIVSEQPKTCFTWLVSKTCMRMAECSVRMISEKYMMTSSNGNCFRVTGHLCGEFTGPPTQRPVTQSFDVFFDLRLNKRLSKHWWGWWLETLSRPLWRHRNG